MIEYLVLSLVLVMFILASIEDIKKREVYDYLNYSLSFFMIVIGFFYSMYIGSFDPIIYVFFGVIVGFFLGSLLYYLGIWGGGDAKFLIGFSAGAFFLMEVAGKFNFLGQFTNSLSILFENLISYFEIGLFILLFVDFVFLLLIILRFLYMKGEVDRIESSLLFLILFLLFFGLYIEINAFLLFLIGFCVFLLIFFVPEGTFDSLFYLRKKLIFKLEEGDRIDEDVLFKKKPLIEFEKGRFGLTKEDVFKISEHKVFEKEKKEILVRNVLPVAYLVGLNFIAYLFKIISFNDITISIMEFVLSFLLISFVAGGILAVFLILFFYAFNFKKIHIQVSLFEKMFLLGLFCFILVLSFYRINFLLLLLLFIVYILLKVSKKVENMMFVVKKNVNDLVPGDWIMEDFEHKGKVLFSVEDFKLGITEEQLERVKELSKEKGGVKSLLVKDGIAFLPPLFVGFLIMLFLL